jgi:hypothetical protein
MMRMLALQRYPYHAPWAPIVNDSVLYRSQTDSAISSVICGYGSKDLSLIDTEVAINA